MTVVRHSSLTQIRVQNVRTANTCNRSCFDEIRWSLCQLMVYTCSPIFFYFDWQKQLSLAVVRDGWGLVWTGADKRVKLKLNYFRDRSDLVLPIIEDRYVTHDAQRDCFVLDLPLLQNNNTGSLSARTPRKQGQILLGKSEEDDLDSPCSRGLSLEPSRQIDSQTRPSERSSRSIETSEEKSLRLMRAARIRDERISIAQHNARCAEFEWRLNHFETCRRKDRRKQQASAQRILLSWLTLAYVSKQWQDAMLRDRWQRAARSHNFGDHYANRSKAHWQRAKNLVHKSVSESRNMHDFRRVPLLQKRKCLTGQNLDNRDCIWLYLSAP